MNLDQKLARKSNARLVISGRTFELYRYENAYLYNLPPYPRGDRERSAEVRARRADNLMRARLRIRRLIAANCNAWGERLKFITYTFAENITDLDMANRKWVEYQRRMRIRFGRLKYLAVVEFQERGAVHYHVLYFNLPYIHNAKERLRRLWGQGYISVKTIEHVKNVGAYVSKYLQQDIMDRRLARQKAFFTSRSLNQPREIRNEVGISEWRAENRDAILKAEVLRAYESERFGRINYTQGIIQPS